MPLQMQIIGQYLFLGAEHFHRGHKIMEEENVIYSSIIFYGFHGLFENPFRIKYSSHQLR